MKLQALAIEAQAKGAYRVLANTQPLRTDEAVPDFSVRNLGFQVRYRYEVAPMSDLYIVYARGGYRRPTAAIRSAACWAMRCACARTSSCW